MNKEYKKLHAEWYDLVSDTIDHNKEINFWVRKIEEAGQPVLELGSGTGRILIPLLEKGFDITGIDTSEDMLNRCRERCKEKKLNTLLYKKSMLDFDLQCKFNMVILGSGGLGLFVDDTDINKMFEHIMAHLKPGGLFIFEFQPVPEDYKNSNNTNWTGDWINGPNDVIIAWRQKNEYNAASHVWKRLFVVEKFINGHLSRY